MILCTFVLILQLALVLGDQQSSPRRLSSCTSRTMLMFDRTYSFSPSSAVEEGKRFLLPFIQHLGFDEGARLGQLNGKPHATAEILSVNSPLAADQAAWIEHVNSISGGWLNMASHFWPLFTTVANDLAEDGHNSYILLITDGKLFDSGQWHAHLRRKQLMQARLGDHSPEVLCVRVQSYTTTSFLNAVCDVIVYDGYKGLSLEDYGEDLAKYICT